MFWKSRQPKCGFDKDATLNCCENEDYNLICTICYNGLGRYRDEGEYYCAEDKLDGESLCNAEAIESPLNYEICNSLDDNCNGQIDEGFSIDEECTGDNGIGGIKCLGDNDTYCEIVSIFTLTFTLTNTNTNTVTQTYTLTETFTVTLLQKPLRLLTFEKIQQQTQIPLLQVVLLLIHQVIQIHYQKFSLQLF